MESYFGFLSESGRVFTASMDRREALSVIARRAVPRLGDMCAIHLPDLGNDEIILVAWAEPGHDTTHALHERSFTGPEAEAGASEIMADLGMATRLAYPLKARSGLLGYFTLGTLVPGGFAPDHEFLVEEFTRTIAFGLESQNRPHGIPPLNPSPLPQSLAGWKGDPDPLQSSQDLLRRVVDGSQEAIWVLDPAGRTLLSNDSARKSLGLDNPEAGELPLAALLEEWRILDPEGRALRADDLPITLALAGKTASKKLLRAVHRKTGAEHWWEMQAAPKLARSGNATLAVMHLRDATPIRSLQSALQQSRQAVGATRNLFQSTMDVLPDCLAVLDSEGRILYANKLMSDFLGPETLARGLQGPLQELPDHLAFCDENGDALSWDQLPLWAALRGEHGVDRVLRYRDGRRRKQGWTRMRAVPILDLRGRLVMVAAHFHDLTSHKQAEVTRESVEARLRQAQKMDAVSRLAGGIAHDFNNLLTSIIGYSDLIAESARSHRDIAEYAVEIRESANRAAGLTAQLLAFGRRQMLHPRTVDINARLASKVPLLQELAGPRVELVFRPASDLPRIQVDLVKWDQTVINLVINATEAMPGGGGLALATSFRNLDQALETDDETIPPGAYVIIEVADTGRGMDAETQARIFEPFFTTKHQKKASGLGLPMVLGFIRQSGGYLELRSEPGRGTEFRIFLPAKESGSPPDAPPTGPESSPGPG